MKEEKSEVAERASAIERKNWQQESNQEQGVLEEAFQAHGHALGGGGGFGGGGAARAPFFYAPVFSAPTL